MNNNQNNENENNTKVGLITESLPNTEFRVDVGAEGEPNVIIAYVSGKMRLHRIKVLIGDRVEVLIDKYGGKGRITKRL